MAAKVVNVPVKTDFGDLDLTNVGSVALDEITSDSDTSVTVTLGTHAGDDFVVGPSNKLVVEGDSGRIGIGTASPSNTVEIEGSSGDLVLEIDNNVSNSANFQIQNGAGNARVDLVMNDCSASTTLTMKGQKVGIMDTDPTYGLDVNGTSRIVGDATFDGSVSLKEKAAAVADTAAYGQLWVKTATPNELYFTDDAGTDVQIVTGGAIAGGGITVADTDDDVDPAADGTMYICSTSDAGSGIEIALPSPASGTVIRILTKDSGTTGDEVTISRNDDERINGAQEDLELTVNFQSVTLVSNGTDWFIE